MDGIIQVVKNWRESYRSKLTGNGNDDCLVEDFREEVDTAMGSVWALYYQKVRSLEDVQKTIADCFYEVTLFELEVKELREIYETNPFIHNPS